MNATVSAFEHPAAWHAPELGDKSTLSIELTARHRDALLAAVEASRRVPVESIARSHFDLSPIATDVAHWVDTVHCGRGLVLLRNLPIESLSVDDTCRMFFGLGTHFGLAVSQSNDGEKIGHVVDLGGQDRRRRAYQSARPLNLHTDRCDYVGMLCLRPAARGGISGYASALAVHNRILETRPELLEPLYRGYRLHRFGEQSDGEKLTAQPVPVFSVCEGVPNVIYIRGYIDLAVDEQLYELSVTEREALDYFDEVANQPEFRFDVQLEAGEATFTNNALLLHNRTAFDDDSESRRARHLLRLWLMDPDRPAVETVRAHKSLRGIERIDGRGTYYQGPVKVT